MYMDQGESIYNIIPPQEIEEQRQARYTSKHNPNMPPSSSTFGLAQTSQPIAANIAGAAEQKVVPDKKCRTMGKTPGSNKNDPTDYLKQGARSSHVETLGDVKRRAPEKLQPSALKPKLKPDVPKTSDAPPVMNLVTSKNFIVSNAVEAILAAPKKVPQGSKDYLNKEDYGKVPNYLKQIQNDIDDEYDYIRQLQQTAQDHKESQMRPIAEDERQELVAGLKAKWEQVNTEYQGSTHITKLDTHGKIKRKEKWEAELSQIEKDIEKLSRKNILVAS